MKQHIKDNYISPITCRLLKVKILNNIGKDPVLDCINGMYPYSNSIDESIYCLLNDIIIQPTCKNPECDNKVDFTKKFSIGYRKFCCIKCSKNPTELQNINLFNGINKISSKEKTDKTLYFKRARELTRLAYKQHKDIINPNNYILGRAGVEGAYQIDHIISVFEGYNKGIDAEYIGSIDNLRVIPWRVNSVKNKSSTLKSDDEIISEYTPKKIFNETDTHLFIEKYCFMKNKRINTKLCDEWFITRGASEILDNIKELTNYLEKDITLPYRVIMVHYKGYLCNYEFNKINKYKHIKILMEPESLFVNLTGDTYKDYLTYFTSYDDRLNRNRPKSITNAREYSNQRGLLHLYYKYYNK